MQGWIFVDEGKKGRKKEGFRTTLPDASIVLQVREPVLDL